MKNGLGHLLIVLVELRLIHCAGELQQRLDERTELDHHHVASGRIDDLGEDVLEFLLKFARA